MLGYFRLWRLQFSYIIQLMKVDITPYTLNQVFVDCRLYLRAIIIKKERKTDNGKQ